MGQVGHAAPSGTVVSEFVERPHGASAAAIVRSSEPILIRTAKHRQRVDSRLANASFGVRNVN
jgi:hypothetical protein